MFAKLRFNSGWTVDQINDAIHTLFSSSTQYSLTTLIAACSGTQPAINTANSFISYAIGGHGQTVLYSSTATPTRNVVYSSPCAGSSKTKVWSLTRTTSSLTFAVGEAWTTGMNITNTAVPAIGSNTIINASVVSQSNALDIYISASARHVFFATSIATSSAVSFQNAMFEFVKNDGFYTETSSYVPVVHFSSGQTANVVNGTTSPFAAPRYYSMRSLADRVAANAADLKFETPYTDDSGTPGHNLGYDFLGTATDRSPLLIPFGVCNKQTRGFMGGAISDLCNVYLGPGNLGNGWDETIIGSDTYVAMDLGGAAATYGRLYLPKG